MSGRDHPLHVPQEAVGAMREILYETYDDAVYERCVRVVSLPVVTARLRELAGKLSTAGHVTAARVLLADVARLEGKAL